MKDILNESSQDITCKSLQIVGYMIIKSSTKKRKSSIIWFNWLKIGRMKAHKPCIEPQKNDTDINPIKIKWRAIYP